MGYTSFDKMAHGWKRDCEFFDNLYHAGNDQGP